VLNSQGAPVAQHRWRRKAIHSLKPGVEKTCRQATIDDVLRQFRTMGTIEVARKKDKKKKKKKESVKPTAKKLATGAHMHRMMQVSSVPGIAPVKGAVPWNNPHLAAHSASFSSSSSSSFSSYPMPGSFVQQQQQHKANHRLVSGNNEVGEKGPAVSFAAHPPHQQPFGSASRPSQQPSSNMLVHHPYQQVPMLRPPSAPAVEFKPYDGTTKNKTFSLQLEPDKGGSVSVSVPSSSSSSSSSSSVRVRPLASAAASIIRSGDGSAPSPPSHKQNPFLSGSSPK